MTLQMASEGFFKLKKGISLDEDMAEEDLDLEEANLAGAPNVDAAAEKLIVY